MFRGTADAISQNIDFIDSYNPEYLLVLSGDHIYKMNYDKMLDCHKEKGAAATIAVMPVPMEEASRFGIMITDDDDNIVDFEEKPAHPRSTLASMGIYIFSWPRLRELLVKDMDDPDSEHDFGKNIIPALLGSGDKLVAFKKESIVNTFGQFLAANHMTQARIAETEKYAHVTFFFNGGIEEPNEGEDRILVHSPKVATYDLKPEMSAYEVCDRLCEAIRSDKYDVIIINFANPDMVGHTGVEAAAIQAIEAVDVCVGRAVEALKEVGGQMFITADHGNAEYMVDEETGEPFTAHTTNPVPFILVNADPAYGLREGGKLCDIVPTLIELMGMEKPAEMTGESLLVRKA